MKKEKSWEICIGDDYNTLSKREGEQYFPFTGVDVHEILIFFYIDTKNNVTLFKDEFTEEQIKKLKRYQIIW